MKKSLFTFFVFFSVFSFEHSFAQGGLWTWISGDSSVGALGVYGTQGIPSVNNHPPGLYEYAEWKDRQGNFWVYGGWIPAKSDLFKYTPSTNEWVWVKGNGLSNLDPVYGTKGIPGILNTPGRRDAAAVTWTDVTGNLWLFGGATDRNDLWKYDISSNEWTWMSGDSILNTPGNHGIKGIPSVLNYPGSRNETCSSWTDSLNNLWLFGGMGFDDAGNNGLLNDLMKYDISSNEWTWMSGSDITGVGNNYGIKGVPSLTNVPGGRMSYTKWKDLQENFWLMGGFSNGDQNDVWRYASSTNEWTWMAGTALPNDSGHYTLMCVNDSTMNPASREEQRSSVTDHCGRFWMYGGNSISITGGFNDLWVFNTQQLTWKWIDGSAIPAQGGNYGSLGVPSSSNRPPSRWGAVAFWGDDNRFYLFSGTQTGGTSNIGDLWVFDPDSNCISFCPIPVSAQFSAPDSLCPGTCTSFLNLTTNATFYQWSFPGAVPNTSTATHPANICYATPGSYDVQLIASNANGSDTLLLSNYITVHPSPPPQSITQSGDTLFAIPGSSSYQWYYNGSQISGATDYFYVALSSGDYNVIATDGNGCEVEAAIFNVIAKVQSTIDNRQLTIFPNPVSTELRIKNEELKIETSVQIYVYNMFGKMVLAVQPQTLNLKPETMVDCRLLPAGMYVIELRAGEKTFRAKFVKQ